MKPRNDLTRPCGAATCLPPNHCRCCRRCGAPRSLRCRGRGGRSRPSSELGYQTARTDLALLATGGGLMRPRVVVVDDQTRRRVAKHDRISVTSAGRRAACALHPSRRAPQRRSQYRRPRPFDGCAAARSQSYCSADMSTNPRRPGRIMCTGSRCASCWNRPALRWSSRTLTAIMATSPSRRSPPQ